MIQYKVVSKDVVTTQVWEICKDKNTCSHKGHVMSTLTEESLRFAKTEEYNNFSESVEDNIANF